MKRWQRCGLFIATLCLVSGCTTVTLTDVLSSEGQGESRLYPHSFDVVWDVVIEVITEPPLDVGTAAQHDTPAWFRMTTEFPLELVTTNRYAGRVLVQGPASATTYGENIGIFISRTSDPNQTNVEVVTLPKYPAGIFKTDWTRGIFDALDRLLPSQR